MMAILRRWWASEHRAFVLDALLAWSIGLISIFVADRVAAIEGKTVAIGAAGLLVVQSLALTFRRRWPMTVYSVVGIGTVAYAWLGYPASVSGIGVLLAIYTVAAHLPLREAIVAAAIYVVGMASSLIGFSQGNDLTADNLFADFLVNLLALVLAWTVGVTLRTRRAYVVALEARAELHRRPRTPNGPLLPCYATWRGASEPVTVTGSGSSSGTAEQAA